MLLPALIAAVVSGIALRLLRRDRRTAFRSTERALAASWRQFQRGGGLAIWLGWCAGVLWLPGPQPWLFPLAAIVIVSFFDDRHGIPALLRLFVQLVAAIAWLWLAAPMPDLVVAAMMAVAIVWMANLYNFMDGSDGLPVAMTVVGFGAYALAAYLGRKQPRARPPCACGRGPCPFLLANWPPARIFLGDAGPVPLGFLAAVFGIEGWRARMVASVVSAARFPAIYCGCQRRPCCAGCCAASRVWQAHRDHTTRRLVQLGLGHAGTLALYAALMVGAAVSALAALARAPQAGWYLLAVWVAVLAGLFGSVAHQWRTRMGSGLRCE